MSTEGERLPPPRFFAIKLLSLVLGDRYEPPVSTDTKNVQVALHLTSNDISTMSESWKKNGFYGFSLKIGQIFTKNPRNMWIWQGFLIIIKGDDYHEVSSTIIAVIFWIRNKNKYCQVATTPRPPLTPYFDSLPYPYPKIGWKKNSLKWPERMILQLAAVIWTHNSAF